MTTSPRVATCLIGSAKTLLLLFVVCFSAFHAVAQKYSNEFLNIGAGARGQAMGNANTALTNEIMAPAGPLGATA